MIGDRNRTKKANRARAGGCALAIEVLEERCLLDAAGFMPLTTLTPTLAPATVSSTLAMHFDQYAIAVPEAGRLTARLHGVGFDTRLSLLGSTGTVLMLSDGLSQTQPDDWIDLHLPASAEGGYFLRIEGLNNGRGAYELTVNFAIATPPYQPLPVGTLPYGLAAADFNHDGILDLATANYNLAGTSDPLPDVSILLGRGDGTFAAHMKFESGIGAAWIATGDFNQDGSIDLAVANFASSTVGVLFGLGDGSFGSSTEYAVGFAPDGVVAVDLDGDGTLDLATANSGSGDVSVLWGLDGGRFTGEQRFAAGAGAYTIAAADFDRDGILDLATANYADESVTILWGSKAQSFHENTTLAVGQVPFAVVTGDFNRDGCQDVAVSNNGSNDVSVLLGGGNRQFDSEQRFTGGQSPYGLVADDFNRDGWLDLASGDFGGGTVSVLMGQRDGTFAAPAVYVAGAGSAAIVSGDFNRDGQRDLAAVNTNSQDVSVFLGLGDGTFHSPAGAAAGSSPYHVVRADFNEDGRPDLVSMNYVTNDVTVLLGRGDGTFQNFGRIAVGAGPVAAATGDFNQDGHLDLVTANYNSSDVTVLLGLGDGRFVNAGTFLVGAFPSWLSTADFDGNGVLDLAVANSGEPAVSILWGNGDGTFRDPQSLSVASETYSLATGDFGGDARPDLAVTHYDSGAVAIYISQADGTFVEGVCLQTGDNPFVLAADLDGDGRIDLAVASVTGVAMFLAQVDGSFDLIDELPAGDGPAGIIAGDFDGDQVVDLAVVDRFSNSFWAYRGNGDGTFRPLGDFSVGDYPTGLVTGDFNQDSRQDIVTANSLSNNLSVVYGNGSGTFAEPTEITIATGPTALVKGDFDGDGRTDVVTASFDTGIIALQLGAGDGTLTSPQVIATIAGASAIQTADLNRDGRPDLAIVSAANDQVIILLGLGDGNFRVLGPCTVGRFPESLGVADLNSDGRLDLAVANRHSGTVSVLFGNGDGTFQQAAFYFAGSAPENLVLADVTGDGRRDVIVTDAGTGDLVLLAGRRDGSLAPPEIVATQVRATALVAGDWNGDDVTDLAVGQTNGVMLLWNQVGGTFTSSKLLPGQGVVSLVAADLNQDAILDLALTAAGSDAVSILLGDGRGGFSTVAELAVGHSPADLVVGDFNGDGRPDLAAANRLDTTPVSTLMGLGHGQFAADGKEVPPHRSTPLVADLDGDGASDVVTLAHNGQILFRSSQGRNAFDLEPPRAVNIGPDQQARDIALVRVNGRMQIAALDARANTFSLYVWHRKKHQFVRTATIALPASLASRIAAADLNGDGAQDLIVAASGPAQVLVYLQGTSGGFDNVSYTTIVGTNPSDLAFADLDKRHGLDIVVTDEDTGLVHVLLNSASAPFSTALHYRAGNGLYSVTMADGGPTLSSREEPLTLVTGLFNGDQHADVIVANSGSNHLALLRGNGWGGLLNADMSLEFLAGSKPGAIVTGDFNDDAALDLAVLNLDSADLTVFLGNEQGGFVKGWQIEAGQFPTGLAARDYNLDGRLDLLVGNQYGQVLILPGNGDGTFQPYQRADQGITLAVSDLNGDGRDDFVFANQSLDSLSVRFSKAGQSFSQDRSTGLLAPGAVTLADLNRDGIKDLIVANRGGNSLMVYLGMGEGAFAQGRSFFVGMNPTSVTVADLDGNGMPDLVVANEGSNNISVLLGTVGPELLTPGPRLQAGLGPVAVAVHDVTSDHWPDILVSNRLSNDVYVIPGVGQGLFNDQSPRILKTGRAPGALFLGEFDRQPGLDLITVNYDSNDLTFYSGLGEGRTIDSGGRNPAAALAGDFNRDGWSDLIVANHGDGFVSMLLGGAPTGPRLVGSLNVYGIEGPNALALASIYGNGVDIYVTGATHESVSLLTFVFDASPLPVTVASATFLPVNRSQIEYLPVSSSNLGFIATITGADLDTTRVVKPIDHAPTFAGSSAEHDSAAANTPAGAVAMSENEAELNNFLLGQDDAAKFLRDGGAVRESLPAENEQPPEVVPDWQDMEPTQLPADNDASWSDSDGVFVGDEPGTACLPDLAEAVLAVQIGFRTQEPLSFLLLASVWTAAATWIGARENRARALSWSLGS